MDMSVHGDDRFLKTIGEDDIGAFGTDSGKFEQFISGTGHTAFLDQNPGQFLQLSGLPAEETRPV